MSSNLALQISNEVTPELGTVVRSEGDLLLVRTASGLYRAKRAASCLLDPEPRDSVLLATAAGGTSYVLSVLERASHTKSRLTLEGDVSLSVKGGRLDLAASDGLGLQSGGETSVVSKSVRVDAVEGEICLQRLGFFARVVDAQMERAVCLAGSLDTLVDRLTQRLKRVYRQVDELEHVRVGELDYKAEGTMSMRGRNAVVVGRELVKLDGGQIHVG